MATKYICRCPKLCANYEEYIENHVNNISSWGEQAEVFDEVEAIKPSIAKMLSDESFARRRRTEKARRLANGYVPKAPPKPRTDGKKLKCNKCLKDENDVIIANNCQNKHCTYDHGKFDRREHYRMMASQ